ncbi:hypothetical protein [Alkalicoccobacillus porphyridii]|uniref:Membrane protein NfeD2 N-terminal transmembrane domain-containing protein n=1 Tax=Alkalicoccobacillus porphyridii TaxID=2597270 RepID=A0A553ZU52_9BACI|nr:hypothetical protein [Alkalicoccobacillus porphyridii]TSB45011.1 hypothetical protein FN960_18750 [Alkalicoccobacillus porphyridii]
MEGMEQLYLYGLIAGGILTLCYILLSDILDGLFDFIPDGWLNPTLILSFVTFLSAGGYLFETLTSINSVLILITSSLISLLLVLLLNIFVLIPLSNAEESNAYTEDDLIGRTGQVIVSIPRDGFGEVILHDSGGNISKTAKCFDGADIPYGKDILVIDIKEGVAYVSVKEDEFRL